MKMLLGLVAVLVLAALGGLYYLAQQSKTGAALGLVDGALAPCPASPNCVCSEAGAPQSHAVAPLPSAAWDRLPGLVEAQGGTVVARSEIYIAATFRSPLFGFVDDVEFRRGDGTVQVRSASRVGRSDLGANAKRVEALRAALGGETDAAASDADQSSAS